MQIKQIHCMLQVLVPVGDLLYLLVPLAIHYLFVVNVSLCFFIEITGVTQNDGRITKKEGTEGGGNGANKKERKQERNE